MGDLNPIRRGQVSRGRNPVRAVNKCNYRASSHFRMILSYKQQASSCKLQAPLTGDMGYCKISYERYKKETSKTSKEIPAIAGTGDQRHANEGLQSALVCCTTGPED